ncbi:MAG: asparagine synthase (glutamine-hydrolyzing) [Thermoleophilia bacterium]
MCGICGVVQVHGEPRQLLAPEVLDRMTDAMTHRGPDDRGLVVEDGVAFGARRLSVVDVEGGHQPFANEDGRIWAMQNGEIYNHRELRDRLAAEGHRFRSRCDTEVLPHLYERYGTDLVRELRGMYGLAVWDGARRRAVIARDRLGVKPIYYAQAGDVLVFASELKSLLASGLVDPVLDYEAIDAYLSLGYVPTPRTPLEGVLKLPPGCMLVVEDGALRLERYWSYPEPAPDRGMSLEDATGQLLEKLEESVRMRLMADVPLGAMLSGGLDSSLIVGLMARNTSSPVETFSVGFREAGAGNELAAARLVSEAFGTTHHELELSVTEQQVDLEDLVWHLDEPLSDLSSLGFLALSQLASRHVTVALSGQGADELLGGYRKHQAAALCGLWDRVPRPLSTVGNAILRRFPHSIQAAHALAAGDPVSRLLIASSEISPAQRRSLARGPLARLDGDAARRAIAQHLPGTRAGALPTMLYLDAQLALVDDMIHYFDRASMAHSLEVRVPFLDHPLVEFCATIPPAHKVRRLDTKHVLKRAARGIVPDEIIDRKKIGFFSHSVSTWLDAQLAGPGRELLLGPSPRYAEILDRDAVQALASGGIAPANRELVLSILLLEVWLSTYLPRALRTPVAARERIELRA